MEIRRQLDLRRVCPSILYQALKDLFHLRRVYFTHLFFFWSSLYYRATSMFHLMWRHSMTHLLHRFIEFGCLICFSVSPDRICTFLQSLPLGEAHYLRWRWEILESNSKAWGLLQAWLAWGAKDYEIFSNVRSRYCSIPDSELNASKISCLVEIPFFLGYYHNLLPTPIPPSRISYYHQHFFPHFRFLRTHGTWVWSLC